MRIFEVRFQLDSALEGRDGACQVAASFQFLSKIELCSRITRIERPPLCGIPLERQRDRLGGARSHPAACVPS